MIQSNDADVIVVGLGAFGSATAYQLARRGARVLGIDRFDPPHDRGSSHGASRITRLAVGEGGEYVPLVRRSHAIWRELEALSGRTLYQACGALIMGPRDGRTSHHGQPDFVQRCIDVAERYGIAHDDLDAAGIAARFPQFELQGNERGYHEPEGGVLAPEACVEVQLAQARRHGAALHPNETVLSMKEMTGGIEVTTTRDRYSAAQVVLTTGPWIPAMAGGEYRSRLRVFRQTLHWFRPTDPASYAPRCCPTFIWMHGETDADYLYGFPMADGLPGVKVATEQYQVETDPDLLQREVSSEERQWMFEHHVRGRLRGVSAESVHAAACLYTVSDDSRFMIDRHPTLDRVTVVSACSGHGFKHSAAIGEALAERLLDGSSAIGLASFGLGELERRNSKGAESA